MIPNTCTLRYRRAFIQKGFYTEELLHRKELHRRAFTQKSVYTEKLLHRRAFTQKSFYTEEKLFFTEAYRWIDI